MPPKYEFQQDPNVKSLGIDPAVRLIARAYTLDDLVELYVDEFPDADDLPDLLTVDDLSDLTETFNERGSVLFLEGVPAMRREESFRAVLEALPVGGTVRIEAAVTLKRTE
jgi:hypothetical protein